MNTEQGQKNQDAKPRKNTLRSMTGYGRGECRIGEKTLIVEVKSINNRYRDISVRLPRVLQSLEDDIRAQVTRKMRRGRLEVSVQMEKKEGESEYALDLNMPLAKSYFRILTRLCEEFSLEKTIKPEELCQMKDVITYKPEELDLEEIRLGLRTALDSALESCDAMRLNEGRVIEDDLDKRLGRIEKYLNEIEGKSSLVLEEWKRKTLERVRQLLQGIEIDENRLSQEVVFQADRSDITEEIVRARSHLSQFRESLSLDEPVGRKLDFLVQEIHRETNTISSKASNGAVSAMAVEIKVELEKIREQIQNVE